MPLPVVPLTRSSTALYGVATVDDRGRFVDHTSTTALGWSHGTGLGLRESGDCVIFHPHECSVTVITKHGRLHLPAQVRHRYGLCAGDRVLLVADVDRQTLAVYPPASLDLLLAGGRP
ncbi:AbrB/MazE/SpoVT family DNA-binding domain-containing protein [Kibdelosporangium aridum]|uniref:Bifunctional DNA-binding transcriptional regulator of stationary/sporulation/toxin gene expression and antitoxin component of the YhaV-PrlF toxin-antitoxin module n=1 Tax=Kibdelosporangium aridum TaxID=2030 RepID=A0A1Y5X271_KIBAR|nr:AbrB/MazE/SpoVT family DNA-binding domain-containing protein [Kibdelosporangium aridum]SMC65920.1 Bifunctional DNA-binding transcriptional regulator of stationary/sporulation/toxin gene expression and antitoxin component of the YhaV-PrlF toxin-antitoxin module [Kibdelosporangium aridum]